MERALVLSVDRWEMQDERTGELRRGLSVWYVNDYREDTRDAIGYKPTKVSADPELFQTFAKARLPAIFAMTYGSRPGAQGKATLTLTAVAAQANVNIFTAEVPARGETSVKVG